MVENHATNSLNYRQFQFHATSGVELRMCIDQWGGMVKHPRMKKLNDDKCLSSPNFWTSVQPYTTISFTRKSSLYHAVQNKTDGPGKGIRRSLFASLSSRPPYLAGFGLNSSHRSRRSIYQQFLGCRPAPT